MLSHREVLFPDFVLFIAWASRSLHRCGQSFEARHGPLRSTRLAQSQTELLSTIILVVIPIGARSDSIDTGPTETLAALGLFAARRAGSGRR